MGASICGVRYTADKQLFLLGLLIFWKRSRLNLVEPITIDCRLDLVDDIAKIGPMWCELQERSACSYFLTWNWIGAWLRQIPPHLRPMLFVAHESGSLIGLAIMIPKRVRRHGIIGSRALFLNKIGDETFDEITIEYNGFLAEPHRQEQVTIAALNFLTNNGWDEVFIDATHVGTSALFLQKDSWEMTRRSSSRSYGVNLQALRDVGKKYLDTLSSNTRYQVRRAVRDYERLGPIHIEAAQTQDEATLWLAALRGLHQKYWTGKGLPGAFSNPFLDHFHHNLVANRTAYGEIQILRISFGEHCIGYLYGFVWNGVVLNYQSGLDYAVLPERNRPGIVAHYAAIEFNCSRGAHYYDFLGGDSQYKQSLSTTSVPLDWVVARRKCLKFRFEDAMRNIRNGLITRRFLSSTENRGRG